MRFSLTMREAGIVCLEFRNSEIGSKESNSLIVAPPLHPDEIKQHALLQQAGFLKSGENIK